MSWWDDDDDILGDEPADRIKGVWRTMLARRRDAGQSATSVDAVLESFAAALRAAPLQPAFSGFALLVGDDAPREYRGDSADSKVDPDLRALFAEALPPIVEAYRKRFDRAPRASEMVKTLEFLLAADPGAYLPGLDIADDQRLRLVTR
jgi:hypothetical protein